MSWELSYSSYRLQMLYVSETWVTKQLLPDLQAFCEVTFSGENICEC